MKLIFISLVLLTSAFARDVRLANRTVNVCIKKSKKVLTLDTQAAWWQLQVRNRRGQLVWGGSNKVTWSRSGTSAKLTFDNHTASVEAYCKRRGSQTFPIRWKLNYTDPNIYYMNITVNCIPCANPRNLQRFQRRIAKAKELLKNPRSYKRAVTILQNIKREIQKRLREELTPEERAQLKRHLLQIDKLLKIRIIGPRPLPTTPMTPITFDGRFNEEF